MVRGLCMLGSRGVAMVAVLVGEWEKKEICGGVAFDRFDVDAVG